MLGLVLLLGAGRMWASPLLAQATTNPPAPARPTLSFSPSLPVLSFLPAGKSPVGLFRELLAMSFVERVQSLTNRTPEARKQILAKVREYETLKPDERELRLKVTELRWYLYPLMRAPATNRVELLSRVPEFDRKLVEDRLGEWDKLSAQAQKELLQNEAVIRCLTEVPPGTNQPTPPRLLERRVQQWQALPDQQRQQLLARFDRFFTLTPPEKDKVLRTLSEPERRQIEKTLARFSSLTANQRGQCIRSFEKFTDLNPVEREQFLKNAERWTLMTPDERQKWRELVTIAPMLPAGADGPSKPRRPPLPPMHRRNPPVATNGN